MRESAGKKVSNANSDKVISTGVPNTVVVLRNERTPTSVASCKGTATCIAAGMLMIFGSGQLGPYLGLPQPLLNYAGISLLPFTAFLLYLATRENLSPAVLWTVIVLNLLWTIDSILLLFSGWVTPTEPGFLFVIAQAAGVAVFAVLEYFGLRKSATAMVVPT